MWQPASWCYYWHLNISLSQGAVSTCLKTATSVILLAHKPCCWPVFRIFTQKYTKKSFGTFILHIFTSSVDVSLKEKMFCLHKINVISFSIRHWVLWNEPWTIHSILKNHSEMFVTGSLLEDDSFIQLLFTTFTASRKFLLNQNYTYSQSVICMGAPHH